VLLHFFLLWWTKTLRPRKRNVTGPWKWAVPRPRPGQWYSNHRGDRCTVRSATVSIPIGWTCLVQLSRLFVDFPWKKPSSTVCTWRSNLTRNAFIEHEAIFFDSSPPGGTWWILIVFYLSFQWVVVASVVTYFAAGIFGVQVVARFAALPVRLEK